MASASDVSTPASPNFNYTAPSALSPLLSTCLGYLPHYRLLPIYKPSFMRPSKSTRKRRRRAFSRIVDGPVPDQHLSHRRSRCPSYSGPTVRAFYVWRWQVNKMVEPNYQRPLCVLLGDWRGRWTSEFHWTILLRSNI